MSTFDLVYTAIPAGFTLILPIIGGTVTTIDWGDGTTDALTTHEYVTAPTSPTTVSILGTGFSFPYYNGTGQQFLTECTNFGTGLTSGLYMFTNCLNLTSVPATLPAAITNLTGMFNGCASFNSPNVSNWNTAAVTNMANMFQNATAFNQSLSNWDTANVTNMGYMFQSATSFNQSLSNWNTANVTVMGNMFLNATSFNQPLSTSGDLWNVSSVTKFSYMFFIASAFNQDISSWHLDSANNLNDMLTNSGLSPDNYTLLLDGWAAYALVTPGFPTGLNLGATTLTYTAAGQAGRNVLTSAPYNWTINDGGPAPPPPCFKEGSKILTDNGYRPIETLRKGDLVKTLKHGYKPIDMIGKRDIYNPAQKDRIKEQLYKCSQEQYPEIFEDLVITGCHSILVENRVTHRQIEQIKKVNGDTYFTDDKLRMPACVDERASVYEVQGSFTIYHIALENSDYYANYGVYANGLLVETCSKRYLKELSKMDLF